MRLARTATSETCEDAWTWCNIELNSCLCTITVRAGGKHMFQFACTSWRGKMFWALCKLRKICMMSMDEDDDPSDYFHLEKPEDED